MSWLSDLGNSLGAAGGVLSGFVPGVGSALGAIGGVLGSLDDPDALMLAPPFPYSPNGMAYGLTRTYPGGDGRGFYLGSTNWTRGPMYISGGGGSPISSVVAGNEFWPYFDINNGRPQPWDGSGKTNDGAWNNNLIIRGGERIESHWGLWSAENAALGLASVWTLDLESMAQNPVGEGSRRVLIEHDNSNRVAIFNVAPAPTRQGFMELVLASRGLELGQFWNQQWSTSTAPIFDTSEADPRSWDEPGGGAVQTWMQLVEINDMKSSGYVNPWTTNHGPEDYYHGYVETSLADWKALNTPEAQAAYEAWQTVQAAEELKYSNASAAWWAIKDAKTAQAEYDAFQAQQEAYYWEQWNASQAAGAEYLSYLTGAYVPPMPVAPAAPGDALAPSFMTAQPEQLAPEPLSTGEVAAGGAAALGLLLL